MNLPWITSQRLDAAAFRAVQLRTIFDCHKYDPQVGDTSMLVDYPLLLKHSAWQKIAAWAEQLSAELLAAERDLTEAPALHRVLGIPPAIARLWRHGSAQRTRDVRVMRFDFHFTTEGWRISECNCDTPGGYNEAVGFTQRMQAHYPGTAMAGNVAHQIAEGIAAAAGSGGHVALVYPTAFAEDGQIVLFLRAYLEACGLVTHLASPAHLHWQGKTALLVRDGLAPQPIDYLFRYFPAEWLPSVRWGARWQNFFTASMPPASNPTTALLTQSKRFPLVWGHLTSDLPTWRALLPPTRDLKTIPTAQWGNWVLKPIYGRFGNDIAIPGVASPKLWQAVLKSARRHPQAWIAQQPFQPIPYTAPDHTTAYPSIGVYTVNGKAAGVYGRLSTTPIIDSSSRDIAILLVEYESA